MADQDIDLIRRYCPSLTVHTPGQLAQLIDIGPTGCWHWPRSLTPYGYGYVWCKPTPYGYQRAVHVHRYMYDLLVGPVDEDYHVHHRCEQRDCWHPLHLEAVTPKDHKARHKN
jgi:HNH endonuclease